MLSFGQQRCKMLCKSILLFLFSFILIENAWSLSVSPAELYFEGNINENLCQEITITGEEGVIIEDR